MYLEGKGNMYVKLPPFITIADASGYEMDQGSMLRYLGEIVLFPTAYLSEYIKWEPIDASSAGVTMDYMGLQCSAIACFNEKGEMLSFNAKRYREVKGKYSLDDWTVSMADYHDFSDIKIPTKCEITWKLKSGDFSSIKLEITEVLYDDPSFRQEGRYAKQ